MKTTRARKPAGNRKPQGAVISAILRQAYRLHRWDRLSRSALRSAELRPSP